MVPAVSPETEAKTFLRESCASGVCVPLKSELSQWPVKLWQAPGSAPYYYNADLDNGIVKTMYVYEKTNDGLANYISYDFEYDEQGRLTDKTVNHWDCWKKCYTPSYKLHLDYSDDCYELTRSDWNERKHAWKPSAEKAVYHIEEDHLTSVEYLQRDADNTYHYVNSLSVLNPRDGLLLANATR